MLTVTAAKIATNYALRHCGEGRNLLRRALDEIPAFAGACPGLDPGMTLSLRDKVTC